jgi:hypothetical protein
MWVLHAAAATTTSDLLPLLTVSDAFRHKSVAQRTATERNGPQQNGTQRNTH